MSRREQVHQLERPLIAASRSVLAVLVAASVLASSACEKSDKANAYVPPPPPEVIVARPMEREVVKYFTYTGVVEASETVDLRARVQGFLKAVHFRPGQKVAQGELLMEIDDREYRAAVARAHADVRAREASLVGAENDARLARELADQRAGPEIDALIKAARRDTVAAEVEQAKAVLDRARLDLDYCEIRSPIDGRIGRNLIDAGNLVGKGEPTLLAQIVRTAPAFVSVDVSESDVLEVRREREASGEKLEPGQIAPGQWRPCELALADREEFETPGRVDYVEPTVNSETGTLRIRTRFENENDALVPGLFARVRFPMARHKAMLVPEAALLTDQRGRYALLVNEKDEVEARRVEIGLLDGSNRVVMWGLTPQDRVIVAGVLKARPGAKVSPKFQQETAAPSR